MFTGWNPIGTEARLFTYKGTTFGPSVEQLTLKLFPSTKPRILCLEFCPLEGEDLLYCGTYSLHAADGSSELP